MLHNLFDRVSAEEAVNGYTDHRKFFVRNDDALGNIAGGCLLYCIVTLEQAANETWYFAKFTGAQRNNMLSDVSGMANSDFPMSFNVAQAPSEGLLLGNLPKGGVAEVAVWIRRVIAAGCGSAANEGTVMRVQWENV